MDVALLTKPELIHDILTTLRNLDCPVTCKIRLLRTPQDTVELARQIEKRGVSSLAVHGRKIADRPRDPAKWSEITGIVSALSIPVIAIGDVFDYGDFEQIKAATGASSVMVAIFSPVRQSALGRCQKRLCEKGQSILWDNDAKSAKQTLKEMIMHYSCLELPEGKRKLYGEERYYQFVNENRFSLNGSTEEFI